MGDLSENFSRSEFACKCGCGFDDVDPALVRALEELRALAGGPLHILSGCRCPKHNKKVGGATHSQHVLGRAADVQSHELTPAQLAKLAEEVPRFKTGGIGRYHTFTHVDVRAGRARWAG